MRKLWVWLGGVIAALIVLALIATATVYWGFPILVARSHFISGVSSRLLGQRVSLQGMELHWQGATAVLHIDQLSIAAKKAPQKPTITIQAVNVQANAWQMLRHWKIFLSALSWQKAAVVMSFDQNNDLVLGYPGMPLMFKSKATRSLGGSDWPIVSASLFSLQNTVLNIRRSENKQVSVYVDQLAVTHQKKGLQQLVVNWRLNQDGHPQHINAAWPARGRHTFSLSLAIQQMNLAPFFRVLDTKNRTFDQSSFSVRAQLQKNGLAWSGGWQGFNFCLQWPKVDGSKNTLHVSDGAGVLVNHDPTWVVEMRWPLMTLNKHQLHALSSEFIIKTRGKKHLIFNIPKIYISHWAPFLAGLLSQNAQKQIAALKIVGDVDSLQIDIPWNNRKQAKVSGLIENMSWQKSENVPEFKNFSGKLTYNFAEEKATMRIDVKKGYFNWPAMFPAPWKTIFCQAVVSISKIKTGWKLAFQRLSYHDQCITAKADGYLRFNENFKDPYFDWDANFSINNLVHAENYLPFHMRKHTRDWMVRGFKKGQIYNARMRWKGPIEHFPYHSNEGYWLLDVPVKNLSLDYSPQWPLLTQVKGHLLMENSHLSFSASTASLAGNVITHAKGRIPDVDDPMLYVKGRTDTQLQKLQHFINVSPVPWKKDLADIALKGPANGIIQLKADVSKKHGPVWLQGDLSLNNSTVDLTPWNININHIVGKMHFTEKGLVSNEMRIRVLGGTAKADMQVIGNGKGNASLTLAVNGMLPMPSLYKQIPFELLRYFRGETPYQLHLQIGGKQPSGNYLLFKTTMKGASVYLPGAFAKKASTELPATFKLTLVPKKPLDMTFSYGKLVQARARLDRVGEHTAFSSGNISFGSVMPKLPTKKGLKLAGTLPKINGKEWEPVLKPLFNPEGVDAEGRAHGVKWAGIDLKIKDFYWGADNFSAIHFSGHPVKTGWRLYLKTIFGNGSLLVPSNRKKVWAVRFNQFDWKKAYKKEAKSFTHKKKYTMDWSVIPPLNITCLNCRYGKSYLGTVVAKYRLMNAKRYLLNTTWSYGSNRLVATMTWGNKKRLQLTGNAVMNNLSAITYNLSQKQYVKSGKGTLMFNASWPGSPFNLSLKAIKGGLKIDLKSMRLIHLPKRLNSSLGIAKLVNLLNIQGSFPIVSWLQKGLYVSGISFSGKIKKGKLTTPNFKLSSSVIDAKAHGYVDFLKKRIDLKLILRPQVTGSLPIVAAIAGGPIIGLFAYALNQIVEPLVGRIIEQNYIISGKLSNPTVTKTSSTKTRPPRRYAH